MAASVWRRDNNVHTTNGIVEHIVRVVQIARTVSVHGDSHLDVHLLVVHSDEFRLPGANDLCRRKNGVIVVAIGRLLVVAACGKGQHQSHNTE